MSRWEEVSLSFKTDTAPQGEPGGNGFCTMGNTFSYCGHQTAMNSLKSPPMKCHLGRHRTGRSTRALHMEATLGRAGNSHAADERDLVICTVNKTFTQSLDWEP